MAEEIIDIRDRIEKMRIQIENEAIEQVAEERPIEMHHNSKNSNISLSLQSKKNVSNLNESQVPDSQLLQNNNVHVNKFTEKKETFPAVSLSVKNPASSKILVTMITIQILSNIGILFFLYLGME